MHASNQGTAPLSMQEEDTEEQACTDDAVDSDVTVIDSVAEYQTSVFIPITGMFLSVAGIGLSYIGQNSTFFKPKELNVKNDWKTPETLIQTYKLAKKQRTNIFSFKTGRAAKVLEFEK